MKKIVEFSMTFKPVMALYMATFVWVYLFIDLFWLRRGILSTALLWQVTLLSVALAIVQVLLVTGSFLSKLGFKRKVLLHCLFTYALLLGCSLGFGWLPAVHAAGLALFTGIFAVVYALMFWGWSLYYAILNDRLNESLHLYKERR